MQIRHLKGSALSRTESKVAFFEYGSQSASLLDQTWPHVANNGQLLHRHHWEDKGGHTATVESTQEDATLGIKHSTL